MLNTYTLKATIDLSALIEGDLGPAKKQGRRLFWPCPFHADHDPSLCITPDGQHYKCFGCGASGDALTWLQERHNLTFQEAYQQLNGGTRMTTLSAKKPTPPPVSHEPPSPAWQERTWAIVTEGVAALGSDTGTRARAWLNERGLTDDTLHRWQIGFSTDGILIPCQVEDALWGVKIRRPVKPKYISVPGSKTALFGTLALQGHSTLVLCEGEFDAMLLHQQAGDLIDVLSPTGGVGQDLTPWLSYLLPYEANLKCTPLIGHFLGLLKQHFGPD